MQQGICYLQPIQGSKKGKGLPEVEMVYVEASQICDPKTELSYSCCAPIHQFTVYSFRDVQADTTRKIGLSVDFQTDAMRSPERELVVAAEQQGYAFKGNLFNSRMAIKFHHTDARRIKYNG
jgi:hypothetical protein